MAGKHAVERAAITELFRLAAHADEMHARRYVTLARKKAMRKRISLRRYNHDACRACNTYWTSATRRIRTTPVAVVYTCLHCGAQKRFRTPS